MKLLDLFITETEQLDEIDMSPSSLRKLSSAIDARAGMEFEMIVPNVEGDDQDAEPEADYEYDEGVGSIQDAYDFFYDGDFNSRGDCQRLMARMQEDYHEWLSEDFDSRWDSDVSEFVYSYLKENASPEEIAEILGFEPDIIDKQAYLDATEKVVEEGYNSYWYEQAREEAQQDFYQNADKEQEWLESQNLGTMMDIESNYDISWPHWTQAGNGGELSIDDVADSFSRAIGRPINSSQRYHGARREAGHYVVEPDGSLEPDDYSDSGLEFVSPPLPLGELLSDLEKVRSWANRYNCYTNDSTGLHINVSVPGLRGVAENLDYVKLALLMGDNYILEAFGRTGNTYCKSALDIVKERVVQRPEDAQALLDKMKGHLNDMASKAIHSGVTSKYTSINTKDGYVEFRSPGGDWLGELAAGEDKIQNTLLRFVVALDAAIDPNKYRNEYLKKLYKILQPKGNTDTMAYFARYAAGDLPKQALKSFIRQAQLERKVGADKEGGKKYWWRVSRPGYGANVEVVATSKEEAIEKGKAEYPDWANATNITASPLRPYQEEPAQDTLKWYNVRDASGYTMLVQARNPNAAMQAARDQMPNRFTNIVDVVINDRANAVSNDTGISYEIFNRRTGQRPVHFRAPSDEAALARLQQYQSSYPDERWGLRTSQGVEVVDLDIPQAQGRAATSPTGQWKIIDGLNREVYRFRAAENTRAKANELAALWARENNFDGNYQVEPVEHDDVSPVSGSTTDLAQRRAQGGEFTGAWRVTVDGEEVHRFSGIGNNQMDANRIGREWARSQISQGLLYPAGDIEITPIMS